jgi:hypothetical protein
MKRIERCVLLLVIAGLMLVSISCVSLRDKEVTAETLSSMQNLGQVNVQFTSFQPVYWKLFEKSITEKANNRLLTEAKKQYKNAVDTDLIEIRNVKVNGHFSGWQLGIIPFSSLIGFTLVSAATSSASPQYGNKAVEYAGYGIVAIPALVNFQKITATADVYVPAQK